MLCEKHLSVDVFVAFYMNTLEEHGAWVCDIDNITNVERKVTRILQVLLTLPCNLNGEVRRPSKGLRHEGPHSKFNTEDCGSPMWFLGFHIKRCKVQCHVILLEVKEVITLGIAESPFRSDLFKNPYAALHILMSPENCQLIIVRHCTLVETRARKSVRH